MFWKKKKWKTILIKQLGYRWAVGPEYWLMSPSGKLVAEVMQERYSQLYYTSEKLGKFVTLEEAKSALLELIVTRDMDFNKAAESMGPESVRVLERGGPDAVKEAHKLMQQAESKTWKVYRDYVRTADLVGLRF